MLRSHNGGSYKPSEMHFYTRVDGVEPREMAALDPTPGMPNGRSFDPSYIAFLTSANGEQALSYFHMFCHDHERLGDGYVRRYKYARRTRMAPTGHVDPDNCGPHFLAFQSMNGGWAWIAIPYHLFRFLAQRNFLQ
jgi:hypothetical protein